MRNIYILLKYFRRKEKTKPERHQHFNQQHGTKVSRRVSQGLHLKIRPYNTKIKAFLKGQSYYFNQSRSQAFNRPSSARIIIKAKHSN